MSSTRSLPDDILVTSARDPRRPALARLVREVYRRAYGARVDHLHDTLLGLVDARGDALAVIGATPAAAHEQLFVEQYLDEPVQHAAARTLGRSVRRDQLAEVGNLAAGRPGAGMWAVTTLAHLLRAQGRTHAVCAATTPLRKGFERLGVPPLDVAAADGERLGDDRDDWGRYYDTAPRVVLIDVDATCRAAAAQPGMARRLGRFWARLDPDAHAASGLRHSA